MPVARYALFCEMPEKARKNHFAYTAVNVTSMTPANAVLRGLAESKSDAIIQVSTGGGSLAERVKQAVAELRCSGTTMMK
jgi:fructose-bisphosphate aldolase, class II